MAPTLLAVRCCLAAAAAAAVAGFPLPPAPPGPPLIPAGSVRGFHSLPDVDAALAALQAAAPAIVSTRRVGTSYAGRALTALCVGRCGDWAPDARRHAVLFTALHHSREPLGSLVSLHYADRLVRAWLAGDAAAAALLAQRALVVLPVVNPDGYAWNLAHIDDPALRMVRKNRRPACGGRPGIVDVGIDINRNYDFAFDHDDDGSNPDPCAEDYRGTAAFSEPETGAVRDLVGLLRPSVAMNWHSYGRFMNLPYAVRDFGSPPPEVYDTYLGLARGIQAIVPSFGYGHPYDGGLYSVNGDASDWMLNASGVFAMSPELGPAMDAEFDGGMWPSDASLQQLVPEGLAVAHRSLLVGGPLLEPAAAAAAAGGGARATLAPCADADARGGVGGASSPAARCSTLTLTLRVTNAGVRDADGDVVVSLVDALAPLQHAALCSDARPDCDASWAALGVTGLCERSDGGRGGVLPACGAGGAGGSGGAPVTLRGPAGLRGGDDAVGAAGARLAGAARRARGRRARSLHHTRALLAAASLLRRQQQQQPPLAERDAQHAANGSSSVGTGGVASRRAGSGGGGGGGMSPSRLDMGELDRQLTADPAGFAARFGVPPPPSRGGGGRRQLLGAGGQSALGRSSSSAWGGGGGSSSRSRDVSSVLLRGGLAAQHTSDELQLRVAVPVAAGQCASDAASRGADACGGASLGGLHARVAGSPPVALLALTDASSCSLYAVGCDGSLTWVGGDHAGCGVCAMLRSRSWAEEQAPGGMMMATPSAPPAAWSGASGDGGGASASGSASASASASGTPTGVPASGSGSASASTSASGSPPGSQTGSASGTPTGAPASGSSSGSGSGSGTGTATPLPAVEGDAGGEGVGGSDPRGAPDDDGGGDEGAVEEEASGWQEGETEAEAGGDGGAAATQQPPPKGVQAAASPARGAPSAAPLWPWDGAAGGAPPRSQLLTFSAAALATFAGITGLLWGRAARVSGAGAGAARGVGGGGGGGVV